MKGLIAKWGNLELQDTIRSLHKYGSGEGNTAYLYTPAKDLHDSPWPALRDGPCSVEGVLTEKAMIHDFLKPVWSAKVQTARIQHYEQELIRAEANLPKRTHSVDSQHSKEIRKI